MDHRKPKNVLKDFTQSPLQDKFAKTVTNRLCTKIDTNRTKSGHLTCEYICLTSLTRAKPKEKMEFPA